jgi:hypothetical protein
MLKKPLPLITFALYVFQDKHKAKRMGANEYTHYRLCESYREGRFIRNRTLLSLGDLESVLPPEKIPFLCKRINQVYLEGKTFIISSLRDDKVEALCTKYVGLLHEAQKIEKAKKEGSRYRAGVH